MPVEFKNASLNDQVVLVTAGAAGIGRSIAERFLSQGCTEHVCDISRSALDEFLAEHPRAFGHLADVVDVRQVDDACRNN